MLSSIGTEQVWQVLHASFGVHQCAKKTSKLKNTSSRFFVTDALQYHSWTMGFFKTGYRNNSKIAVFSVQKYGSADVFQIFHFLHFFGMVSSSVNLIVLRRAQMSTAGTLIDLAFNCLAVLAPAITIGRLLSSFQHNSAVQLIQWVSSSPRTIKYYSGSRNSIPCNRRRQYVTLDAFHPGRGYWSRSVQAASHDWQCQHYRTYFLWTSFSSSCWIMGCTLGRRRAAQVYTAQWRSSTFFCSLE